jgi:hypothetical protein
MGQMVCVALQEPDGQKYPALHAPSHIAAVRVVPASPYLPALQGPLQVETVSPAVPPHLPQAHRPLQVAAVCPAVLP